LPVEVAEGLEILLQIFGFEVRSDPAKAEDLPKFPERQARQLASLSQRKTALGVEVNRKLDEKLIRRQSG
jgi:hypothetical protein